MKWKTLILFCRIQLIASQKPVIFICCKIGGHTCQIQSKRTTSKNLAVSSDGFLFRQMMRLSKRDFLTNIWVDLKITIQPVWVRTFFDKQWAAHDIFFTMNPICIRGDIIEKNMVPTLFLDIFASNSIFLGKEDSNYLDQGSIYIPDVITLLLKTMSTVRAPL